MKRVYMSKYGIGQGDCLTACAASILECEIDDIPDFSSFGKEWHRKTVRYLQMRGMGTIFVPGEIIGSLIVSECLCIAIFETDTSELHAKIGKWSSEYSVADNTWAYSIDEVFDPNKNGVSVGKLQSVFLIFKGDTA